jgi:WD40 repeat protein/serine/threonine protein kinase
MSHRTLNDREGRLEEAIAEYLMAVDAGQRPGRQTWLQRYPDLSTELEDFLADDAQMEALATPLQPASPVLCPGQIVGDYELLEIIGVGGMGMVFKARHAKGNFLVALKMVLAGAGASSDEIQRFVREIELHARLDHAHVVPIYHVGEHEGLPYFTMKLVEAGTLKSRLDKFQLSVGDGKVGKGRLRSRAMGLQRAKRIARLMTKVGEGVHYAHQHGLLHRDLKPGNILLHGMDHPYVADFGLVLRADEEAATGRVEGTVAYMAPEQARGIAALSTAVDVYGLGAILYELLTGRPPFTGKSKREVLEKVLAQEPAAPSQLQKRVPRDLEAICLNCLRKEPSKRYPSARHVVRALDCFIQGKPVPGLRTPRWQRVVKWVQRKPAMAALITAVLLAMGLAVTEGISKYWLVEEARREAELNFYIRSIPEAERLLANGNVGRAEQILDQCPHNLRHFEWYLLKRQCRPNGVILGRHDRPVTSIAANLASGMVATAGEDGAVRLWSADTAQQICVLETRAQSIKSLASSFDGRWLAAAGTDTMVRVWEVATRSLVFEAEGDEIVALSADGRWLAAAGLNQRVKVWEVRSGRQVHALEFEGEVYCLAFSRNGKWLGAGGRRRPDSQAVPKHLAIWELPAGQESKRFRSDHTDMIYALSFSPDSRHLVTSTYGAAIIWNTESGDHAYLPGYEASATALSFDKEGRYLAASFGATIRVWDFWEKRVVFSSRRLSGLVSCVSLSPDGGRVAYGAGKEAVIERWEERAGVSKVPGQHLAFDKDGRLLAVALEGGQLEVRDVRSEGYAVRTKLHAINGPVSWVALSPDGKLLATASSDGVRLWDVTAAQQIRFCRSASGTLCAAFSPDGELLASSNKDGSVRVLNVTSGLERVLRRPGGKEVPCVCFSPDGKRLAIGTRAWTVSLYDMNTGKETPFQGHKIEVTYVVFSPDGRWLASASADGTVIFRDLHLDESPMELRHNAGVLSIAFSPDGRRLASVGQDGRVHFWDTSTGQELLSMTRITEEKPVKMFIGLPPALPLLSVTRMTKAEPAGVCLAFCPDPDPNRRLLATAYADGNVELWDASN